MTPDVDPFLLPSRSRTPLVFSLIVAVLFIAGLLWIWQPFRPAQSVHFQVVHGLSARDIAGQLKDDGLIRSRWSFLFWVKLFGHASTIKTGAYELSTKDSGFSIFRKFRQGPPLVKITFPEGWTSKQMAAALETRGITKADDFLSMVSKQKLEGYLFPDTYFLEQNIKADAVTARLTNRFKDKEPKDFKDRAKAMGLTEAQLVTLASIVEREARAASERPIIAGVFYNRLRKHWYLESCATVEYSLGGWKPHLTYKDLQVKSPYNTYRHGGLPPGPICNPGTAALEAASHPAATDMMFFVADGQGTHRFSRYYNEHLAAQKKK